MSEMIELIEYEFKDEQSLLNSYMPFVKGCGIFIRTHKEYELKQAVTLSVKVPEDTETYLVEGHVVWITPKGSQGNKPVGIGVQLGGPNGKALCNKIETLLAGKLKSANPTDTI